jgi:hypothetical protein
MTSAGAMMAKRCSSTLKCTHKAYYECLCGNDDFGGGDDGEAVF